MTGGENALSIAQYLIDSLGVVITIAVPVAFGAAILGFFYGLAIYVFNSGNEASKEKGVMIMKWGLVALFVMASVYGIIRLAQNTLLGGTDTDSPIPAPRVDLR